KQTWHLFWFRFNDMNGTNLYRLDFGNSLANNPTAADVVPINVSFSAQVAQSKFVRTESGKYVLFIGNRWGGPVRVDFGTDVLNTSPTLVGEMSNGAFTPANPFRSAAMDVVKHGDN